MKYRRRLRSRIVISFLLLGAGLTTLFAAATLGLRATLENQLIEGTLKTEAENLIDQVRRNPDATPSFSTFEAWTWSERTAYRIPLAWQNLAAGVHDIVEPDAAGTEHHYKLAVARSHGLIAFVRYDISRAELGLYRLVILLSSAVLLFSLLAFLIGVWSSSRVMKPVADLAARLQAFGAGQPPELLSRYFADDEVGQLANALDDYAHRLTEVVRRDREFNADVSHELRTPLAVIQGATELMLTQPDLSEKSRQRLKRIERAAQQCADLTAALLMLSRNERGSGVTDARRVAEGLLEANRVHLTGKPVALVLECGEGVLVDAPEPVFSVALGNLISNACKYTVEGEIRVRIDSGAAEVEDTGPGISAEEAEHLFERGYRGRSAGGSKGAGIGLAIVRRLCDLYGWRVSIRPRADRTGTVARLEWSRRRTV